MRAVSVHGFSGGFELGTVQAGWDFVGKKGRGVGFGVLNCLANRHMLGGDGWEADSGDPTRWTLIDDVDMVFGNPPCSGFSTLSRSDFRGNDSSINECMWELVRYAGRVDPQIVIFESVQQTLRQGIELMRQLHAELERLTGLSYDLIHVLHNNAGLGGVAQRKRYFWVASRVPFGVESPDLQYLPTLGDMLHDLSPLGLTMEKQQYPGAYCHCPLHAHHPDRDPHFEVNCGKVRVLGASRWSDEEMHDGTGFVDGHDTLHSPTLTRVEELCATGIPWNEGETMGSVMKKHYEKFGYLPPSWEYNTTKQVNGKIVMLTKAQRLIETDFFMGVNQPFRWYWERMARVITGGACHLVLHPKLDRTLTQREAARIQGFPDAWKIWPVRFAPDLGPGWGKGVPVHSGRWIAEWAKRSIEGNPGSLKGNHIQEYWKKMPAPPADLLGRESVIDITNSWQRVPHRI